MIRAASLTCCIFLVAACAPQPNTVSPQAQKGVLSVNSAPGISHLDGEWEFYPRKFVNPGEFNGIKPGYIRVPGIWNDYQGEDIKPFGGHGHATYRLKVAAAPGASLSLLMPSVSTAYRLFVNGILTGKVGEAQTTRDSSRPAFRTQIIRLPYADSGAYELVFQVANFSHRDGGIWNAIQIGGDADIENLRIKNLFSDFFLAGAIFIMGLYHIILYLLRRKDRSPLGFGLFCILIASHIFFISEFAGFIFFPGIPWETGTRFVYIIWPLAALTFSYYATRIFPLGQFEYAYRLTKIALCLFVPLFVLLPFDYITYADWALEAVTGTVMLIGIYLVVRTVRQRRVDALVYLGAFVVFVLCYVNDALYTNHIIYATTTLLPAGLMIFLLAQSFLLSKRFAAAFAEVEELSESLERKVIARTAELRQANALKDKFVALVSHDLRSPISGMRQILKILSGMDVAKQKAEFADLVGVGEKSMATLTEMIEQVLDLTRIRSGKMQPLWEKADLAHLVRLAAEKISLQAKSKGVTIDIRLSEPVFTDTDPTLFGQSMQNLIHNAVKFCSRGGVITISHRLQKDFHLLSIADTGTGIDPELIRDLFKINVKTSSTGTGGELGNGLGLPLSYEMIAALGGEITVTSGVGKGAIFVVSLPAEKPA